MYKISHLGGCADFYILFYGVISGLMGFHDAPDECALDFVQILEKLQHRPWQ
jgi:hypothetical protein